MLNNLIKGKKKSLFIYVAIGIVFVSFVFFIIKMYSEPTEILSQVVNSVGNKQALKTAPDGRINVLVIGVDKRLAENSIENSRLTDTLILVSISPKNQSYSFISFPRDIWIDNNFGGAGTGYVGKINGIYSSLGPDKLIKVIENLTKQKIQYHVAVSFSGFIEAIDTIGGVKVYVDNTFDDYTYPIEGKENDICGLKQKDVDKIFTQLNEQKLCLEKETCILFDNKNALEDEYKNIKESLQKKYDEMDKKADSFKEFLDSKIEKGENTFNYDGKQYELKVDDLNFPCRYETLHFDKGLQKMDGATALKYARSRHAYGVEGSDFARAKRQQKVIDAIKNKVLSFSTFTNPVKLKELYDNYKNNVETNITFSEAQSMYSMLSSLNNSGSYVISSSNDETTGGILDSLYGGSEYGYAFVLIPKNNNFNIVSDFIIKVLNKTEAKQ